MKPASVSVGKLRVKAVLNTTGMNHAATAGFFALRIQKISQHRAWIGSLRDIRKRSRAIKDFELKWRERF